MRRVGNVEAVVALVVAVVAFNTPAYVITVLWTSTAVTMRGTVVRFVVTDRFSITPVGPHKPWPTASAPCADLIARGKDAGLLMAAGALSRPLGRGDGLGLSDDCTILAATVLAEETAVVLLDEPYCCRFVVDWL